MRGLGYTEGVPFGAHVQAQSAVPGSSPTSLPVCFLGHLGMHRALNVTLFHFQALLGYGDGDVFGMSCLSVCGPSSDKKSMRQLISLQRAGQPGATKLLCYKRDGTPFWFVCCPLAPCCAMLCYVRTVYCTSCELCYKRDGTPVWLVCCPFAPYCM